MPLSSDTMLINTYVFASMNGQIGSYGESIQEMTRPGVDGYDLIKMGKRGERFMLQTFSMHLSEDLAKKAVYDYELLITDTVNITKGYQAAENVLVLGVKSTIQKIGVSTDGNSYMVRSKWTMKRIG